MLSMCLNDIYQKLNFFNGISLDYLLKITILRGEIKN